ncbi:MAG: putative type secretion system protein [Actinomycetota bacterium]|jgi:pilus assembly protein CpaF
MTDDDIARVIDEVSARALTGAVGDREVMASLIGRRLPLADDVTRRRVLDGVLARVFGLGRLGELLADPTVDEVVVHRGRELWVERSGVLAPAGTIGDREMTVALERILAPTGRRLDRTTPAVDARLADGTRLCAVIPPVAVDGTELALRRHRAHRFDLDHLASPPVADLLRDLVANRSNLCITGPTSSGKTTLLAALVAEALRAPGHPQRVVLIEDTAEIDPSPPDGRGGHVVRLESRPATADGTVAVSLLDLVATALRLRPDRLVVGEIRGDEVVALVQAMNTGHDGSMATCHANGPEDALHRLEGLVLRAAPTWPLTAIRTQLLRSVDHIVHLGRDASGERRVTAVAECVTPADLGTGPLVRVIAEGGRVLARPGRSRT